MNDRYLGFKFRIGAKTHYGWARLNARLQGSKITLVLTGYAYETVPNKPIIAGKTKESNVFTLEPASLGHLAQGASGLSAWHKTNPVAAH